MTQVTVDNTVVSLQLTGGDSTTVPTGEKWKVDLIASDVTRSNSSSGNSIASINGIAVKNISAAQPGSAEITLDEGDKIKCEDSPGSNSGINVSGFDVS